MIAPDILTPHIITTTGTSTSGPEEVGNDEEEAVQRDGVEGCVGVRDPEGGECPPGQKQLP